MLKCKKSARAVQHAPQGMFAACSARHTCAGARAAAARLCCAHKPSVLPFFQVREEGVGELISRGRGVKPVALRR